MSHICVFKDIENEDEPQFGWSDNPVYFDMDAAPQENPVTKHSTYQSMQQTEQFPEYESAADPFDEEAPDGTYYLPDDDLGDDAENALCEELYQRQVCSMRFN